MNIEIVMWGLVILNVATLTILIYREAYHARVQEKLLDRVMANSLPEFKMATRKKTERKPRKNKTDAELKMEESRRLGEIDLADKQTMLEQTQEDINEALDQFSAGGGGVSAGIAPNGLVPEVRA